MRKLTLVLVLILAVAGMAFAQEDGETTEEETVVTTRAALPDVDQFQLEQVANGFSNPLYVTHAGDDSGRLFVVEQTGRVWIVEDDTLLNSPFLDLSSIVSQDVTRGYSERGLLGLAFHPNYEENGLFYVNYTNQDGDTRVARYSVSTDDPNRADPESAVELLAISQPFPNHNGGHMDFGPDGYLYISVGDGGSAGDPLEAGQDPSTLLGTILRLDVNNSEADYTVPETNPFATAEQDVAPEVWAWGLRNVWRFSFDRATGDLYMGDVGQNRFEEINFEPAESDGGLNYGWDVFEAGTIFEGWMGAEPVEVVDPVATYNHDLGCSVTGGYIYRGEAIPELEAAYLYSDYCSGRIWAAYRDESGAWNDGVILNTGRGVSSFGEDESGELYLIDYRSGELLRFAPAS
jgi:glucose/arabinose dehydrogenase